MRTIILAILGAVAVFAQPVVNPYPPASHLVPGNTSSSSGTVTNVSGACGVAVTSPTTTPVVSDTLLTTAHSGPIVTGDCGYIITEGSGCVWTIAQAGTTGFAAGWYTTLNNTGSGSCTVTATTSIFFGGPTANISGSVLTVPAHTSAQISSNGTNYQVLSGGGGATPATVTISTSGPVTVATGNGYYFNNTTALTYNLPIITSGVVGNFQCFRNYTTRTGAITLQAPASTFIDVIGVNGSSAGSLVSSGALGDAVCLTMASTTQYVAYVSKGSWVNN